MLRQTYRKLLPRGPLCRAFSSAVAEKTDPVRSGIQKLMEHAENTSNPDRSTDLKRSLAALETRLREAESCVEDYRECKSNEEMDNAEKAVDQAVGCLVEVLEEMKISDEKLDTDQFVRRIKELRSGLDDAPTEEETSTSS